MLQNTPFDSRAIVSGNDRLLISLFIAALIHAILILGVRYKAPEYNRVTKAIEITLVNTKAQKAPEHARLLAQAHQIGAGEVRTKLEPPKLKIPSAGQSEPTIAPQKKTEPVPTSVATKVITKKTTTPQPSNIQPNSNHPPSPIVTPNKPQPTLSVEDLRMQISQLGKQIIQDHQTQDQTRIKSINSVSTHEYVAAQYIMDWEAKVERTGNLNYPEAARKKNFNGRLTMDVGIKADGSIYSIHISKTSGFPELDEAAKRIVSMSAPFPPLPKDLLKELDVLVITRVWSFSDETGMLAN